MFTLECFRTEYISSGSGVITAISGQPHGLTTSVTIVFVQVGDASGKHCNVIKRVGRSEASRTLPPARHLTLWCSAYSASSTASASAPGASSALERQLQLLPVQGINRRLRWKATHPHTGPARHWQDTVCSPETIFSHALRILYGV